MPAMLTTVPGFPMVGVSPEIVGPPQSGSYDLVVTAAPVKGVTAMGPAVAPLGTVAVIWMADTTVTAAAGVPLNLTCVESVKPVP